VEVFFEVVFAGRFVRCSPGNNSNALDTTSAAALAPAIHIGQAALTAATSLPDAVMHIGLTALSVASNLADGAMHIGLTSLTIPISVADTAIHMSPKDQPVFTAVRCGVVCRSGDATG
jgi:hypothetical protein